MTYQVAFLIEADDPGPLLDWLTAVAHERLGYLPTIAVAETVEETFPAEWAEQA